MANKEIAKIFREIAELLDIGGEKSAFRLNAYKKVAMILENLETDISVIYKEKGLKGVKEIKGIGDGSAKKIEEYVKTGKLKYLEELKEDTAIQQIITHFFKTKGVSLNQLKQSARQKKIIYSRFTKPAKQLIELAGSVENAGEAIDKVAEWANSRKLDYSIETIFKKWLELDRLKPKEIVKKPFYQNCPMVWSQAKRKWYVIDKGGQWLEFCGKENEIEWRLE